MVKFFEKYNLSLRRMAAVFLCLMAFFAHAHAEETASFMDIYDPTQPSIPQNQNEESTLPFSQNHFTLQAILFSKNNHDTMAMINGKFFRQHEIIEHYEILSIHNTSVYLQKKNAKLPADTVVLKLDTVKAPAAKD